MASTSLSQPNTNVTRDTTESLPQDQPVGSSVSDQEPEVEVSVVIPCLNEHETIARCVEKALRAFREHGIAGEVVVADNGSTDGSRELAAQAGARVVPVTQRGYGNALMGGIAAAQGRFIVMGDADDSYDFGETPKFVAKLREGYDLVQGCRLPAGGGTVKPGAMPFLHRWLGNPALTALARVMFRIPFHDVYCGMRGFTKEFYQAIGQRCTGMEFATEMVVKSRIYKRKVTEVPITLWPDGRVVGKKHLRTFRDGWRTLRFYLLYSPRWLFWHPGLLLMAAGLIGYALALPGVTLGGITLDVHTLLVASLALLLGQQSAIFAVLATTYAINTGLRPSTPNVERFFRLFNLERGLALALGLMVAGLVCLAVAVGSWWSVNFGALDYAQTMRWVIPGVTLATLGAQTLFGSFLCSILSIGRTSE